MDATSPPGDRLKAWREGRELSQTKAGEMVEVSAPTWCDWEQGGKTPKAKYRKALEMLTGISESDWSDDEERALLDRVRERVGGTDATATIPDAPSLHAA